MTSMRGVAQATATPVKAAFAEARWPLVFALLDPYSASPSVEGLGSLRLERFHFAALAASPGSLRGSEAALKLASTDWSCLLLGGGGDQEEHAQWRWRAACRVPHGSFPLARTLTSSFHLFVLERRLRSEGQKPLGAALVAVRQEIEERGWIPPDSGGLCLVGGGSLVEFRGGGFVAFEGHAVDVIRISAI